MKARQRYLEERIAVKKLLEPYKKGGEIVTHIKAIDRYSITVPKPLRVDGQIKITAATEHEAYHKAYVQLCRPATTLRDVYNLAMQERDEDPNLTDQTQARMRRDWNKYYEDRPLADRPIAEIKPSEIDSYLRNIQAGYAITRTAYINVKSILNITYDYAVSHDMVAINMARQVHVSNRGRFKPQGEGTYTDEDRRTILRYIEDHNKIDDSIYYAAIYLMFHLCARIGEIKALRWTDYNEDTQEIYIGREVVTRDGRQVELEHTKGGEHGSRWHQLVPKAVALLERLKENRTDDHIFLSEQGDYLSTVTFNKCLMRLSKWTDVPYQSSHKIRFWAVTALCRASGSDITAVGALAGHHCQQTTMHYIRNAQNKDVQIQATFDVFG